MKVARIRIFFPEFDEDFERRLLRLQVSILLCDILDAGTILQRVEVMMAYDAGSWIRPMQFFEQDAHGAFLRLGAGVGGLSADVQPTLVADANRVGVVVLAVGADDFLASAWLYLSVTTNHVVVADGFPTFRFVPVVDLLRRRSLVGPHCRTMNNNQSDLTHDCTKKVVMMRVMSDPTNFRILPMTARFSLNFFSIIFLCFCFGTDYTD